MGSLYSWLALEIGSTIHKSGFFWSTNKVKALLTTADFEPVIYWFPNDMLTVSAVANLIGKLKLSISTTRKVDFDLNDDLRAWWDLSPKLNTTWQNQAFAEAH